MTIGPAIHQWVTSDYSDRPHNHFRVAGVEESVKAVAPHVYALLLIASAIFYALLILDYNRYNIAKKKSFVAWNMFRMLLQQDFDLGSQVAERLVLFIYVFGCWMLKDHYDCSFYSTDRRTTCVPDRDT